MKKLAALLLSALLICAMTTTALAEGRDADPPKTTRDATTPTPAPAPSTPSTPSATPSTGSSDNEVELSEEMQSMLALVNQARKDAGLEPLAVSAATQAAAETRARECTTLYSHSRPDGSKGYSVLYDVGFPQTSRVGENIGRGYSSSADVMKAWLNSQGHSANILSADYKYIGMATVGSGEKSYWVQVFVG